MQNARKCLNAKFFAWALIAYASPLKAHGDHSDHDPKVLPLSAEVKVEGVSENVLEKVSAAYVAQVEPIFRRACFDCHSDQTHYPWYAKIPGIKQWIDSDIKEAREHLDMSQSFPFRSKHSIDHDLEEISDEIEEKAMPPKAYAFMHHEAEVSDSDRALILEWIKSARASFQKSGTPVKPH